MKKIFLHRLLCLVFAAASVATTAGSSAWAEPIRFLTHSVGQQTYVDDSGVLRGKPHGGRRAFNVELVREMMQLVGIEAAIEVVPFKRGLQRVQSEPGYALFNVNRTPGRETTLRWVGPLQRSITHFYENRAAATGIHSLDDARKVSSICVLRGNVHHRFLEKHGFENIFPANSYANCIDMLALQRVTLTPLSDLSSISRDSQNTATQSLQKTPVKLMESEGYLAFSRETPMEVVAAWQAAFDHLVATGRYDELVSQYLGNEME